MIRQLLQMLLEGVVMILFLAVVLMWAVMLVALRP